jgi:hypothetical protein
MKALKPLLVLAVIVGAIVAAVKYTGDSKPALPEDNSVATSVSGEEGGTPSKKKSSSDGPRMEERYGFTSQTVDP